MDELEFYNGQFTGQQIDDILAHACNIIVITLPALTESKKTFSHPDITSDHYVLRMTLTNPTAKTTEWRFTTGNGTISLSTGTVNGTTNVVLILGTVTTIASAT